MKTRLTRTANRTLDEPLDVPLLLEGRLHDGLFRVARVVEELHQDVRGDAAADTYRVVLSGPLQVDGADHPKYTGRRSYGAHGGEDIDTLPPEARLVLLGAGLLAAHAFGAA